MAGLERVEFGRYGKSCRFEDKIRTPSLRGNDLMIVTGKTLSVYPDMEYGWNETKDRQVCMPLETYLGGVLPYGKQVPVLHELIRTLQMNNPYFFSSTPRKILEMAENNESKDWKRDMGPEIIPTWVKYNLGKRLAKGKVADEHKESVRHILSNLRTGSNIDIKSEHFDCDCAFEACADFFRKLHRGEEYSEQTINLQNRSTGISRSMRFTDPIDTSWNEAGFRFPAATLFSGNDIDIQVKIHGAIPFVKVIQTPIPINQDVQIVTIEFGYLDPSLKSSNFESEEVVTMRLHLTSVVPDLRNHPHNSSWQKETKGYIRITDDGDYVLFDRRAVRAWQSAVLLDKNVFDDPAFGVIETIRNIRGFCFRDTVTSKEFDLPQEDLIVDDSDDAFPGGRFLRKSQKIIKGGVREVLKSLPCISTSQRYDLLSDVAGAALTKPVALKNILRLTDSYKWFNGIQDFNDEDFLEMDKYFYRRLGEHYGYGDEGAPYEPPTGGDMWWVENGYCVGSTNPRYTYWREYGKKLSWDSAPDGLNTFVEAIEWAKKQKSFRETGKILAIDTDESILSRFVQYMSFVF